MTPVLIDNTSATAQNGSITFNGSTATVNGTYDYAEGLDAICTTFYLDGEEIALVDSLATVSDSGLSVSMPTTGLQFTQGVPATQLLATFTDAGGDQVASDYGAEINWGDGATTAGKVVVSAGVSGFTVWADGMHAYTDVESHTMIVTVYDEDGSSAEASETVAAAPPSLGFPCWGQTYQVNGSTFSGLAATFVGSAGTTNPNDFTALVTVTGGSQVAGSVQTGAVEGEFYVTCTNVTIPNGGIYGAQLSVVVSEGGTQVSSAITILTPLLPQFTPTAIDGGYVDAIEGQQLSAELASFDVSGASPAWLSASVAWGGAPSNSTVQVVSTGGNGYAVLGTHTYNTVGSNVVLVDIWDSLSFSSFDVWATISVTDAALSITPAEGLQAVENTPLSVPPQNMIVATFTAQVPSEPSDFLALITWEPENISMGVVAYDSTADDYTISGDYTYDQPGWYPVSVQVFDTSGTQVATISLNCPTIDVKDGALSALPVALSIDDMNNGDMVQVAYFTDADPAGVSSDYSASMSLPESDCEVVPAGGPGFDVYASLNAPYTGSTSAITVTIADNDGGASAMVTDTALEFDSGSSLTLTSLPSGSNVTLDNGTSISLGGNNLNLGLGSVTLIDGSLSDGSITASAYTVENGSISANLLGSGAVTVCGDGTVDLTGDNTYTGGTTIQDTGTLAIGSDQALGDPDGGVTFLGAGTLQALGDLTLSTTRVITTPTDSSLAATIDTNGFDVALPGGIGGQGGLVKIGDVTLDLSGVNNAGLQGGLTVSGGFVAVSDASNLGYYQSPLVFNGGGLQATASFIIPSSKEIDVQAGGATFDTNGYTLEVDAVVGSNDPGGAAGGVTVMDSSVNASGVLLLKGSNLIEGGVTIVSGTLAIGADAALGDGGPLTFTGQGALQATGNLPLGGTRAIVTPDDPTLAAVIDCYGNSVAVPGVISGAGGLTAVDTSNGGGGTLTLTGGNNTFTGVTTVGASGETLILGNELALQDSTFDTSGPGTFSFGALSAATFGGLQGSGDLSLPAGFSLSVGGNGFITTFSGSFSGSGSLTVDSTGELVLAGGNSGFAGVTTVLAGILEAASPTALPVNVSVASGATLAVGLDGVDPWDSSQINRLLQGGDSSSGANLGLDTGSSIVSYDDTTLPSTMGLVVLGSGTLVLTGNNTGFSGGVTILGGTLQVGSISCLGDSSATITFQNHEQIPAGPLDNDS